MSKNHKPKSKASSVGLQSLPTRKSRHGVLLADLYRVNEPEVTRVESKIDKKTGEVVTRRVVVRPAEDRAMTEKEMEVARTKLRANEPTNNYGKKNEVTGAKRPKVAV